MFTSRSIGLGIEMHPKEFRPSDPLAQRPFVRISVWTLNLLIAWPVV